MSLVLLNCLVLDVSRCTTHHGSTRARAINRLEAVGVENLNRRGDLLGESVDDCIDELPARDVSWDNEVTACISAVAIEWRFSKLAFS